MEKRNQGRDSIAGSRAGKSEIGKLDTCNQSVQQAVL
jgi:hypothetical protein